MKVDLIKNNNSYSYNQKYFVEFKHVDFSLHFQSNKNTKL